MKSPKIYILKKLPKKCSCEALNVVIHQKTKLYFFKQNILFSGSHNMNVFKQNVLSILHWTSPNTQTHKKFINFHFNATTTYTYSKKTMFNSEWINEQFFPIDFFKRLQSLLKPRFKKRESTFSTKIINHGLFFLQVFISYNLRQKKNS